MPDTTAAARQAEMRVAACRSRLVQLAVRAPILPEDAQRADAALQRARVRTGRARDRLEHRQRHPGALSISQAELGPSALQCDAATVREQARSVDADQLRWTHQFLGGRCSAIDLDAFLHLGFDLPADELNILAAAVSELIEPPDARHTERRERSLGISARVGPGPPQHAGDPGMFQQHITLDVPATVHGPAYARRAVEEILNAWSMIDLLPAAKLIVSELVTNAVLHAQPSGDALRLRLENDGRGLRMSLADCSPIAPVLRAPDAAGSHGRGLQLIAALATRWGTEPHPGGKSVWVQLDRPDI